jgi:hypothetical protein
LVEGAIINNIEMERDSLKLGVVDSNNEEGFIHIRAINQNGKNILNMLFMSDRIKNVSLEAFQNLELDYFLR